MHMAAGRHGGYRKHEFRDREFDINVSKRRDFYYPVDEFDPYSNEGSERQRRYESCKLEQGKDRVLEVSVRSKQKDGREREAVNGGYHSSSSSNNSGSSKRGRSSMKVADREPGELSSESGSDGADMSELQVWKNEDWEPKEGTRQPAARKRKISPITWDREEKHVSNLARHESREVSPNPRLPQGFCRSPNFNQNESADSSQSSPLRPRSFHSLQHSPVKPQVGPVSVGSPVTDLQTGHSIALRPEEHGSGGQRLGNVQEDEDYVPLRNISASRWAIGNNSPQAQDEGEVYDGEQVITMKKKMPQPDLVSMKLKTTIQNLGDRESTKESIEGARVKSSDSDREGHRVGSASEIEYTDTDLDRNDFMEVDSKDLKRDVDSFLAKTYSEENSDENPEPLVPPQRSINMLQGCRSVHEFEKLNRIDEGTYGVVFRAKDKKTGEIVALKKVKMAKEKEGFPLTSLREINILLSLYHPSIVHVKEVVVGSNLDSIFMAMEYMEHDLKGLMETMRQPFSQSEVKCLMKQLLEGVNYLHENWVLHRDLKTSNLLFNNHGELKICDFGLSRQYGSPLKPYTPLVVTLWYRAPELLLGAKQYSTAIDMWSLGCIMAELLAKEPLFNGNSEIEQIRKIFETLGMPNEKIWPGFSLLRGAKIKVNQLYNKLRDKFPPTSFSGRPTLSEAGFDLLNKFLTYNPEKRITAKDALDHDWFREVPLPKSKDFMPTFPAQHAQDRRIRRTMKSPDPLEQLRRKEAQRCDISNSLFG